MSNEAAVPFDQFDKLVIEGLEDMLKDTLTPEESIMIMSSFTTRMEGVFERLRNQPSSIRFDSMPVTTEQLSEPIGEFVDGVGTIILELIMRAFDAEMDIYLLQYGQYSDHTLQ